MSKQSEQMMPAQRRRELVRLVQESGHATVSELADRFLVSLDTIRRDLDELAAGGLITRARGGALSSAQDSNSDLPLSDRTDQSSEAKRRIAAALVELLRNEQSILLNGGTTTLAVASALHVRSEMTVITSNLLVPGVLDAAAVREVYLIGGSVRLKAGVTVGPLSFSAAGGDSSLPINADVAVIGVGGISGSAGYSMTNMHEAEMTRAMLERSSRRVIVCDSSKFERFVFAPVASLAAADLLVTDHLPERPLLERLREAGVEVMVAPPE